jgi:7,8-dihydropterin-6-yl-methyl-4-(beta-D-ribofuranosyl)aminobenzene 5'-phosphate synthase
MRIVTLIENLAYKRGLIAEHGLSFYIETCTSKLLFDTGQSDRFIKNAEVLGIDLSDIDAVIISHGHYDHTGGLYSFLRMNSRAKVFVKKEAFQPKYHNKSFIGIHYDSKLLNGRMEYVNTSLEIDKDFYIMPDITIKNTIDTNFQQFNIQNAGGSAADIFQDELYLAIRHSDEISIISSCSHRGITNILDSAVNHFNLPLNTILGGFHIRNCESAQLDSITMNLKHLSVKSIGACHCTGVEKYAALKYRLGENVFYNHTGCTLEIN